MDEIKLSEFCDNNERTWNKEERDKADKIINYLTSVIDTDIFAFAQTTDNLEIYKKTNLWFLQHKGEFIKGLENIGVTYEDYQKSVIYGVILSITRKKSNVDFLIKILKINNIIDDIVEYEKDKYKITTKEFGDIYFETAEEFLNSDDETFEFVNKMGDRIIDGCHEISFHLIEKNSDLRAVTSICTRRLNAKYYHSFVLDGERVIDLTGNLVMPKNTYYLLNNVEELNNINYEEYLEEKDDSIQFDESNTIFPLLRNALYKQYKDSNE